MPDHPSSRYYVGLCVTLDGEEWMITVCNYIFDTAILRRKSELHDPSVGYHGEQRELPFARIPLPD